MCWDAVYLGEVLLREPFFCCGEAQMWVGEGSVNPKP